MHSGRAGHRTANLLGYSLLSTFGDSGHPSGAIRTSWCMLCADLELAELRGDDDGRRLPLLVGLRTARARPIWHFHLTTRNLSNTNNQALSDLEGALGIAGSVPSLELISGAAITMMLPRGRPE